MITTIAGLLDDLLESDPDRVVLIGRSGRLSARQLDDLSTRGANVLRGLGVEPGTRVAASLPNDTWVVVAFLSAMKAGAIWLGVNRPLAPPEKAYMLADSGTRVFLGDSAMIEQIETQRATRSDLSQLVHLVSVTPNEPRNEFAELLAAASTTRPAVSVDPYGPAAISYTSGTTGFPKGAVHSQHNMLLPGHVMTRRGGIAGRDGVAVLGVPLPLTILNLMILGPLAAYQGGTPVVAMDRVDAIGMAEWIAAEGVTTFSAVPSMVYDLLTNPEVTDDMLASIAAIGVGGADMPDAFRRLYEERFGKRVGTGYGLTEAPTTVTSEDVSLPRTPGACGTALPQVSIHILNEADEEVPVGEVGEVCVGPSSTGEFAGMYRTMLSYWNRPEETARALRNGLLHTGDIGCVDEHGNLFIKDRKNDLIIRGGANVYPAEVERVIHDFPGVAACAVVGSDDERLGERVVAFVEAQPGVTIDVDALLAHCGAHLARYKVPDSVTLVETFERTPMGKIRKTTLRELSR